VDLLKRVEVSDEAELREAYKKAYEAAGMEIGEEELKAAVADQIAREKQKLSNVIQTKYSNMIQIIKRETSGISTEHTDIGARMSRLELISTRLVDDRLSFKKLLSDNEDTDMIEASYMLNEALAVYQASLQAGAGIIQLTLANFIR